MFLVYQVGPCVRVLDHLGPHYARCHSLEQVASLGVRTMVYGHRSAFKIHSSTNNVLTITY
jgi:hypothetical protein